MNESFQRSLSMASTMIQRIHHLTIWARILNISLRMLSIYSTLQDLDILFEMGLLESHDSVLLEERELLPQKKGGAYGLGGFKQTKEATRAFHFLTLAGLRKVCNKLHFFATLYLVSLIYFCTTGCHRRSNDG